METLDTWTIVLFSLVVFLTGISFTRTGRDIKSFFAAGGAVPWWINGLSLFMSFFSTGTFVVWGSIAYTEGWVAVVIQWTMAIAGLLIGFFIAPRWRKTGSLTVAEFLTSRLGYDTQKVYTYLFLFISVFATGAFLYPIAKIIEVSTGFPINACILVIGGLIALYTAAGGLWAVIVTDVLQFIVLFAAVCILIPLSLDEVGGIQKFIQQAPEGFFSFTSSEYSIVFMLTFCLYNLVFIGGNWAYVQRYTSVSSPAKARKVGWLFGGLYLISPIIWMLPPMIYRIVNPDLSGMSEEGAYLMMCKAVLPAGILGLILGGMIFATSSSVNTTLNIAAGVFTNDIYRHFFPKTSDSKNMHVARLATLGFGVLTILIALLVPFMGGIVEVVLSVAALTGGAMYLPPIWSLFSKRQTGLSILSTTVLSLSVNVFFKFFSSALLGFSLNRAEEMAMGVLFPILVLSCFEIYYRIHKYADQRYDRIFSHQAVEEKSTDLENTPDNRLGILVIASGIIAISTLMIILGFLAESATGLVSGAGLVILAIGVLMMVQVNRLKKNQAHDSRKVY